MARRKDINDIVFEIHDGFQGTGAVDDASIAAGNTTIGVDTFAFTDSATIIPVGARFKFASSSATRTVSATENSQIWTLTIDATGGTFDLILNGETASAIAFDASSATIQTALEGLASVTAGDVTVTGDGPHTIQLAGNLKNTSGNTLVSDAASLTGGASTAVVASVQDGLSTWEITFAPALVAGALPADDEVITFYPRKIAVKVGEGDIGHSKTKAPIIDTNRGVLDGARKGIEQALSVNFTFVYDWLASSTTDVPTVDEVLEQEGEAADWTNAAADPCEPYQVTLKLIDAPDCGSELAEIIFYKYFLPTDVSASVESASVDVTGTCVAAKPEKIRVTNDTDTIEQTTSGA